jgi:hypothetical protein
MLGAVKYLKFYYDYIIIMKTTKKQTKYISNKIKLYYINRYIDSKAKNDMQKKRIKKVREGGFSKIYNCIISRIYSTFQKYNIPFNMSYDEIIGCTEKELETYIYTKLKPNMTFDNHGEWEIDHIKPVSSFTFTNQCDIFLCFNYTNLQPLWFQENRQKSNKII